MDGAETLGVGGSNLPAKKDKHRANLYSQRVQQAIQKNGFDLTACLFCFYFCFLSRICLVGEKPDKELPGMGSTSFLGFSYPNLLLVFLNLLFLGTCIIFFSRVLGLSLGLFLKKNQTTPRPSEHPPVMGKKMSKRSGGIKRLQIQNHFMAFKQVPRCR